MAGPGIKPGGDPATHAAPPPARRSAGRGGGASGCPDQVHCCPVHMSWTGRKALFRAGYRRIRRIGTWIAARPHLPSLPLRCHPGLVPGTYGRGGPHPAPVLLHRHPHPVMAGLDPGAGHDDGGRHGDGAGNAGRDARRRLNRTAVDLIRASMGAAAPLVGPSCGRRGRVDGRIKSGHDVGVTAGAEMQMLTGAEPASKI